eukprot:bmy_11074T0
MKGPTLLGTCTSYPGASTLSTSTGWASVTASVPAGLSACLVEASIRFRSLRKGILMVRCMKPLKIALPSWSSFTCERSTPVRCWRVRGSSTSCPTTVAGSTSWTRRSTGSPSTGVQLPQLSSLSAALWSDDTDAAISFFLGPNAGWPCRPNKHHK